MPLYPAKTPVTAKADSDSPIENFLIRMLFPQGEGSEPDIPMNPVSGIAKGAFFKKLRQSLREQAIDLRVRGVLSPREADSYYAEQLKSIEPLKQIKRKQFKDVYGVSGSPRRIQRKLDVEEPVLLQELKRSKESPSALAKYSGARELLDMFEDGEGVRGFATGTQATKALTNQDELRPIIALTNKFEPQYSAGETAAHEFLHARSRGAKRRIGKWESLNVVSPSDLQTLRRASIAIDTHMPNVEELFAEVGAAHITKNKPKLEVLKAMGLEKQVDEIGNFVKSLLKEKKAK